MKKRLTIIISLILAVMLLPVNAYEGSASQTTKKKNGWLIVTHSEDGVTAHYTGKKTKVTVPNGVDNLASLSSSVREVRLSASVFEVNGLIEKKLEKITVASGNQTFIEKGGVLFDKSGKILSLYPSKRKHTSYTVPKGVKSMTQIKNNHLRTLNLPDSLETIRNIESKNMTKLYIPPNVDYIEGINIPGQITISRNNRHFIMSKGVLFNKKKTKIILYPARKKGKKYTLPKGVRDIDFGAFYNNKHLKTIHIPQYTRWKSLLYPNQIPFACANSPSLRNFTVSSKNPHFKSRDGVLYNKKMTRLHVYPSGRKNKSFTIPATVYNSEYNSIHFEENKHLENITLGEKTILWEEREYDKDFANSSTVWWCISFPPNIQNVTVPPQNSKCSSDKGVLLTKDKTGLLYYPEGRKTKSYTVPDGITNISCTAFENTKIKLKVTLPDNIQSIGNSGVADKGYSNITFVVKKDSVSHKTVVKLGLKYTLK